MQRKMRVVEDFWFQEVRENGGLFHVRLMDEIVG